MKTTSLSSALNPNIYGVWGGRRPREAPDVVESDLLTGLHQPGRRQGIRSSVANHAVLKIGEPGVGAHLKVNAETLDFEIAKVEAFGAVEAAKDYADGVCGMAGTGEGNSRMPWPIR